MTTDVRYEAFFFYLYLFLHCIYFAVAGHAHGKASDPLTVMLDIGGAILSGLTIDGSLRKIDYWQVVAL